MSNKTICADCKHSNKDTSDPCRDRWRCKASWPTTRDVVTGDDLKFVRKCRQLNHGNCPHFKSKDVKPVCAKCIHVDRVTMASSLDTQCMVKWRHSEIDPVSGDPVSGDPVEQHNLCRYRNEYQSCKKFSEAPESLQKIVQYEGIRTKYAYLPPLVAGKPPVAMKPPGWKRRQPGTHKSIWCGIILRTIVFAFALSVTGLLFGILRGVQ